MSQNRSHAVMAQRAEPSDSLDFFPTPAWGTRALCRYVLDEIIVASRLQTVWEPACGQGDMARPLAEYFRQVRSSDIYPYGYGDVEDFLDTPLLGHREGDEQIDWVITNPPFNKAEEFAAKGLAVARVGVALLCRISWFESEKREPFFEQTPPAIYAPFIGRLPMFKGRLDRKGSTATAYAWFVWVKGHLGRTTVIRIPSKAKRELDRDSDWDRGTP